MRPGWLGSCMTWAATRFPWATPLVWLPLLQPPSFSRQVAHGTMRHAQVRLSTSRFSITVVAHVVDAKHSVKLANPCTSLPWDVMAQELHNCLESSRASAPTAVRSRLNGQRQEHTCMHLYVDVGSRSMEGARPVWVLALFLPIYCWSIVLLCLPGCGQ